MFFASRLNDLAPAASVRRPMLALGLALVAAVSPALAGSLFKIPIDFTPVDAAEVAGLGDRLQAHSDALAARPDTGYDWVFPYIYAKVTRRIVANAADGVYQRPDVARAEVGEFYEMYARNNNLWMHGHRAEPHWQRAVRTSRALAKMDFSEEADRKTAALAQAMVAIWAHTVVDLSRNLLVVKLRVQPEITVSELKRDYFKITEVFGPATEEMISEAKVTPEFLKKAWPHLPRWLQRVITSPDVPVVAGAMIRTFRRFAWTKFRYDYLFRRFRDEVASMETTTVLPLLELGTPRGPGAPMNSFLSELAPQHDGDLLELDAAFEAHLEAEGILPVSTHP